VLDVHPVRFQLHTKIATVQVSGALIATENIGDHLERAVIYRKRVGCVDGVVTAVFEIVRLPCRPDHLLCEATIV
jgi:hypothetical protein